MKPRLIGLTRDGLKAALGAAGVETKQLSMRVSQLWNAMYVQGATGFDAITTLAKPLRGEFADTFSRSGRRSWPPKCLLTAHANG